MVPANIQVLERNVITHIARIIQAVIQTIRFAVVFESFIKKRQSICAVANNTLLEFFTENAYVSVISKPPKLVNTEYNPKNKADDTYIAKILCRFNRE